MGIMTVNGVIAKESLGIVTPHEHALIDISNQYPGDKTPGSVGYSAKVSPDYYTALMADPYALRDNLILDDHHTATHEVSLFAKSGGKTFVDVTPAGIGRDVNFLKNLSQSTGLNVVAACGFYTYDAHPARLGAMTIEQIADEMIKELTDGIDGTDIKAGIIGEIGTSTEINSEEIKVLKSSAIAHTKTGAPVMVHLSPWAKHGTYVAELLINEGVRADKICLCHTDILLDTDYMKKLMDMGVWIEFDNFGKEFTQGSSYGRFPSDTERVEVLCKLIDDGYAKRLLFSCDICLKNLLKIHGGPGYSYVLDTVADLLRARYKNADEILNTILVHNPAMYLDNPCLDLM